MATPSILIVPDRYKSGVLYSQLPENGAVDFDVTRATPAFRTNASGVSESVASGVPRLDYPAAGGCPALLVEPAATNGILNSTDTATNWVLGINLSSGYVDVIGVSGNNITVAVSGSNVGTAAGRLTRSTNNVALASGSTYTISFLMKKTGTHTIGGYYALITGAASGDLGAAFDVSGSFSSGSIYNTAGTTNRIRRVEQWGTDVYRCSETFTMTASGTLTTFNIGPTNGVATALNPPVGLGIAFAAPQIELGSVATSPILTTSAAVTRNADVISKTGVSGFIGQTEGTIYVEVDLRQNSLISVHPIVLWTTAPNRLQIIIEGNRRIFFQAVLNGLVALQLAPTNVLANGVHKIALGYESGNSILYLNGVSISQSTTTYTVPPCSNVNLGSNAGSTAQLNDRIRAAAIYTTRLSNTDLAALTSL